MSKNKVNRRYVFKGFTIFDIFHIVFGITFLVLSIGGWFGFEKEEIIPCIIELVFAIILLTFIDVLSKDALENNDGKQVRKIYIFGSLIVAAAVFTPHASSSIVSIEEISTVADILTIIATGCALVPFFLFLIALVLYQKLEIYAIPMWIGYILLACTCPLFIVSTWMHSGHLVAKILGTISSLAILFPSIGAFISMVKSNKI